MSRETMSFTPGPWEWYGDKLRVEGGRPVVLAPVQSSIDVSEEDARLIAAAPELLEALKGIMDAPMSTKAMLAAHAAIVQATGGEP